jgi:hypothetical protein
LRQAIRQEVRRADGIVFLVGPGKKVEPEQRNEWSAVLEAAWEGPDRRMIPLLVKGAELPGFLSDRVPLRITREPESWNRVAKTVIDRLRRKGISTGEKRARARALARRKKHFERLEKYIRAAWPEAAGAG